MTPAELLAALEAAERAICGMVSDPTGGNAPEVTRAAVLAFLRAMPEHDYDHMDMGGGQIWRVAKGWDLHTLAAAVGKETQP